MCFDGQRGRLHFLQDGSRGERPGRCREAIEKIPTTASAQFEAD